MMFIKKSIVEQLLHENIILRKNQESMMNVMNAMAMNIRNEFAAVKEMIKSVRNVEEDITFRPKPISSIEQLNLIEKKLETLPETFVDEYKKMVCILNLNYYLNFF